MIPELLKCAALPLLAQAIFMSSVLFISGQLLPSVGGNFYAHSTPLLRTVIASIISFPLGNFMLGYAYAHFSPAWVSPLTSAAFVLISISFTVLLLGIRPSLWLVPATLIVITGCVWVSVLLLQK